nr:hypothetical protein CFP56_07188 [Quercus suber]
MVSEATTQATSHGGRGGFGGRGHSGGRGGRGGHPDDEDDLDDEALEADWDMYMDGAGGSAHKGGCIFVPTPGRPTPPIVQAEPTQEPSLPNPDEPAVQIEQIRSENIEPVYGLRRSLRTDIHSPSCQTGKTRPAKAVVEEVGKKQEGVGGKGGSLGNGKGKDGKCGSGEKGSDEKGGRGGKGNGGNGN